MGENNQQGQWTDRMRREKGFNNLRTIFLCMHINVLSLLIDEITDLIVKVYSYNKSFPYFHAVAFCRSFGLYKITLSKVVVSILSCLTHQA